MFRRGNGGRYYLHDNVTDKQLSLGTADRAIAKRLQHARNEAEKQPAVNRQIARAYLAAGDPEIGTRTWTRVMEELVKLKRGENQARWRRATQESAFDGLREIRVLETRPEHFLRALEAGGVSTNNFLRRLNNFALDMGWLPWPVMPKRQWPPVRYREKRAVTVDEHALILSHEANSELRAFFSYCWHLGGAQSDVAHLKAEDIDWKANVVSFFRAKTGNPQVVHFGAGLGEILKALPSAGLLFLRLAKMDEKHRASLFQRACRRVGVKGISLHSYRYAWAERAKRAGYPERFAQMALGHNSKAVHRAYARKAQFTLPALEDFEREVASKVVPIPRIEEALKPVTGDGSNLGSTPVPIPSESSQSVAG